LRAEQARSEQPHRHLDAGAGHRTHRLSGLRGFEIAQQFGDVLRERVGAVEIAPQCARRRLVGAGRAAEAQVDAIGIQRRQRAELLGHLQRCVVRQHDPACADADGGSTARDMADQHRGRGAGDAWHVVVLGQPVAVIAQGLGVPGQVEHVDEGIARRAAFRDGGEVE
jgi:hypothetical protein